MSKLILYPTVKVTGRDFSKCEVLTQPNQSMSLKEIITRFVKGEPLPDAKQVFYQEGEVDLEKAMHEDLSVMHDRAVAAARKFRMDKEAAAAKAKAEAEAEAKAVFDAAVQSAVESRLSKPQGASPS